MFRELTGRTDVTAVHVEQVEHGTALRARIRVTGAPELPDSAFVKLAPVRPAERLLNRFMALAHNESEFYRVVAAELDDMVPAGYGVASDRRRGRAVVIMEDLAERGARFLPVAAGCSAEEARAIAATLGRLHRTFWMSDRMISGDLTNFAPGASRATTAGPHAWHLLRVIPKSFDDIAPPEFRAQSNVIVERRWDIARLMRKFPRTLLHGDTHLGNMCFAGDQPVLFDWQLAACGPALKDLAYFACTSIEVDQRRAIDEEIVRAYLGTLNDDGTTRLTFDDAWDSYRLFAFTAYLAAGVTAVFGRRLQCEDATRAGVRRSVAAMRDLDTLTVLRDRLGTV